MATSKRKTQAERSAETQRRLLEATLDCIAEQGYPHTTTTMIVARAGVSRGAQVHHYPTKLDLVTAAVAYLYDREYEDADRIVHELSQAERPLERLIRLIWEDKFHGRLWEVTLELVVAARTDPELREWIKPLYERYHAHGLNAATEFLRPREADSAPLDIVFNFCTCVLRGMAFQRIFRDDPAYHQRLLTMLIDFAGERLDVRWEGSGDRLGA